MAYVPKRRRRSKSYILRAPKKRRMGISYEPTVILSRKQMERIRKSSGEKKGVDTFVNLVAYSVLSGFEQNTATTCLNLVSPGNGSWNRVGRKINLKSIRIIGKIRYEYRNSQTTGMIQAFACRMLLVWDKQPSGEAIPDVSTIIGRTTQNGNTVTSAFDAVKYDTMSRFKIIKDRMVVINPTLHNTFGTGDAFTRLAVPVDIYKKLNYETTFSGDSTPATIADINSGALYLFFVTDNDNNNEQYTFQGSCRLRYTD